MVRYFSLKEKIKLAAIKATSDVFTTSRPVVVSTTSLPAKIF
jgi:hypothetical protein